MEKQEESPPLTTNGKTSSPSNFHAEENDNHEPTAFNPSLPEVLAETIKGDSIGDTLYSERFVLSTILRLTKLDDKPLSEDEEFEANLCSLWDMTIERDVVKLLLEHGVLEVFSSSIQHSNDPRLVEILIGTIANMCSQRETREALCSQPDITYPIMENIACFDPLTLIQLMRFLQAVLVFENTGDESLWFQHIEQIPDFVDRFSFILSNSCNLNLLVGSFEAINAICTKFSVLDIQPDDESDTAKDFKEVFVKTSLVASINDAFKQLLFPADHSEGDEESRAASEENADGDMEEVVSKKKNRIMNLFLDILVILAGFESISMEAFVDCLPETLDNVAKVLATLCSPINLLPLTVDQQGVLENVNELFQSLQDPFHGQCFSRIVLVYSIIRGRERRKPTTAETSEWDESDDKEEKVNAEELCFTLLELITRISVDIEQDQLEGVLKDLGPIPCQAVFDGLTDNREEIIQVSVDKFALALKNLWNVERANGDVQL